MKYRFLFIFLSILPSLIFSQDVWKRINESSISLRSDDTRDIIPQKYVTFEFNAAHFLKQLESAPMEFSKISGRSQTTMELPMPDGSLVKFAVWEAPMMEKELAQRYPSIKSYKGYQIENKLVIARFGTGPNGFHASIKTPRGMAYIDPYSNRNQDDYISYYTADHLDNSLRDRVLCGTTEEFMLQSQRDRRGHSHRNPDGMMELRKYRLALGCTGEWGAIRVTKEKALADMVTFVERANIVFETELSLTAVLIAKNDELIFLDGETDPYTNPDQGLSILGQNTNILNGRVGGGSYEIGHVFSVCYDVGGVAGGNICTPGKGAGVTCHNSPSISNGIVLVFNHEVGHQMTAGHTFNHCGDTDQLSLGTAFEPGSGSTIMGYAGACGSDNLGIPRDDYYHVVTLEQILSFTNTAGSDAYECAEKIDINNHIPVINLPYKNGFSIPKSTPFFLQASAVDENGDIMTYNWDQFDNQTSSPLGSPTGNAPIFRSLSPTSSTSRYFPNVSRILNGQFTDKTELLPTYGRDLTFRFVVRDNNPMGTAAVWEEMNFKVAENAGPFKLTYPILDYKLKVGKELNVNWDVANTDKAPVNCKYVDIYMSYNNSLDFNSENLVLVSKSTPNDGQEVIIVPNKTNTRARIVVKATENIFMTTGLFNSRIDLPETPSFFMDIAETITASCLPEGVNYEFTTTGLAGLTENIRFEVISGLPIGAIATFSSNEIEPGESTELSIDLSGTTGTADYFIVVRSYVEGIDTIDRTLQLKITSTDLSNIELLTPENGISGLPPVQKYTWAKKDDATSYELEVASSPDFKPEHIVIKRTQTDNTYNSNVFLDKATIYYWRVRSSNACGYGDWSTISAFNTEALNCNVSKTGDIILNISTSGMPKVEAPLVVFSDGIISDINVKNIRGDHQRSGDLVAFLVAPSGKEVMLWSRKCGTNKGFNVGVDDQSNDYFQCPINTGKIYRPESPLNAFNGESMKGTWIMRIEDRASGEGGRFQGFDLELCANIVLNPPVLTRNEVLNIHPKDQRSIDRILLLSEDQNNTAEELKYTLVKAPVNGILSLNDIPMNAGSLFTQNNIDKFDLKYIHTADTEDDDSFSFTVSDGQGGWVTITDFIINVDAAIPSGTVDGLELNNVLIYPNPANDLVNIQMVDTKVSYTKCTLMDITGRALIYLPISNIITSLDIQHIQSGIYLIKLSDGKKAIYRKFIKR
ncbi:MAG: T9SS type A sorting domain-containing protein [Saprospiraceae bacterium]|nr:T9SS type A sorting domain-containing protein [Saprospiraceae bacterium]